MSHHPVESSDRPESEPAPASRRGFLIGATKTAGVAGAAALAAGMPQAHAQNRGGASNNNRQELVRNFVSLQKHENEHVQFFQRELGAAYPQGQFRNLQLSNLNRFINLSVIFENTGAQTYLGAAPLILNRDRLAQAGSIAIVEARHAGWLNTVINQTTTGHIRDGAFELPITPSEAAQRIAPFLVDPNVGFGLAAAITTTPSDANDIAIFRFAAVLEQLEAEFYNLNVPRLLRNQGGGRPGGGGR